MGNFKQNKAITLIALIITIIILLILAGISIATLTGENGILKKVSSAGEQTKIAEYKEILIIIGNGLRSEKILEDLSTKEYIDRYQEAIEKEIEEGDTFEGTEVERKNDATIKVTTKEGYVYLVTEDEVKYLGKEGETAPPDLQESDIEFKLPSNGYTNTDIEVEIIAKIEMGNNKLQYSTDGTNWTDYTEKITIKENGTIYTRLINDLGEIGGSATKDITMIDKELPNEATIQFSATTTDISKSVTATVTQSDKGTSDVDITKCKWIYTTNSNNIGTNEASYTGGTFSSNPQDLNLNATTPGTYYLHVLTIDKAGNKRETIAKQAIVVNDIDRTPPNDAQITLSSTKVNVGSSVTATVRVSDGQSGIDIAKCKYIINNSANKLGINSSSWSSGTTLTSTTSNVSITSSTRDTLYLHILSVDNYNNKTETVSNAVLFSSATTFLEVANKGNGAFYTPSGWSLYFPQDYWGSDVLVSNGGTKGTLTSNTVFDFRGLSVLKLTASKAKIIYATNYTANISLEVLNTSGTTLYSKSWQEVGGTNVSGTQTTGPVSINLPIDTNNSGGKLRVSVWCTGSGYTISHWRSSSICSN